MMSNGQNRLIYLDSALSPNFFKNAFIETFGKVNYYMNLLGAAFGFFLLCKFISESLLGMLRSFEVHRLTGATFSFTKTVLAGVFQVFYLSAVTSMFDRREESAEAPKYDDLPKAPPIYPTLPLPIAHQPLGSLHDPVDGAL